MKNLTVLFLLIAGFFTSVSAQKSLPFTSQKVHLKIPLDLPGLQMDSLALKGDYLEYDITGMEIKDTIAYELHAAASSDKSTPWLTLQELIGAYQTGSIEKISALYTKASQTRIKEFLSTKAAMDYYLAEIKKETFMRPYFAMEYDNGIIAFVETQPGKVDRFRFEKVKNTYLLAAYAEKGQPMINNAFCYYFYKPQPHQSPQLIQGIDSVVGEESPVITFKVKRPGDWVSIFLPMTGYSTMLTAQDNGFNDTDPTPGIVKMHFYASKFTPAVYNLYAVASNYPILAVSNPMTNAAIKFTVKVKP